MDDSGFSLAAPEQAGIPSAALGAVLDCLAERRVPMHSLLVMRRGRLALECYWAPFDKNTLHRMFSQTKSMVSLAIGLLCAEGRLRLEDKITDYFSEKLPPGGPSRELAALTVRDMLRMATPYRRTVYKDWPSDDWVGCFFTAPADHMPGSFFSYDTSSSHVLCALAERLAGQPLLEFLRSRFLDEIGFSSKACCLKDAMGITQGGSGLMATSRDMLRVLALLAAGGRYKGRQLLPESYLREALSKQIDTEANNMSGEADFSQGYGYQFWMLRHGGWCMYGMGGQFSICIPQQELLIVTTADVQGCQGGAQLILDTLWTQLLPALSDTALPPDPEAYAALLRRTSKLALQPVMGLLWSGAAVLGTRQWYALRPNAAGLTALRLETDEHGGVLQLRYGDQQFDLEFGAGYCRCGDFLRDGTPCAASAAWKDPSTLLLRVQLLGKRVGSLVIQLVFRTDGITVLLRSFEEYPDPRFEGTADS